MLRMFALALVYFLAAKFGLAFATVHPSATLVWFPTGIAIAAFLFYSRALWPGVFFGAFLANITTEGTIFTSLGIAFGNTMEGLFAAIFAKRFADGRDFFREPQSIFRYTLLAGIFSTMISASVGTGSLLLGGFLEPVDLPLVWATWWLGDIGGALIVAPLLLIWSAPAIRNEEDLSQFPWPLRRVFEAFLMFISVALSGAVVFGDMLPFAGKPFPFSFLAVSILMWPAFRFGVRESIIAALLLSVSASWGAIEANHLENPENTRNGTLLMLQFFFSFSAVGALLVASTVERRKSAERKLLYLIDDAKLRQKKLADDNKRKSNFLAVLSHELRNPLAAITLSLDLIEMESGNNLSPEIDVLIKNCKGQFSRITHIVDDLLQASRIMYGKFELRLGDIVLGDVVERAVNTARPLIDEHRHALRLALPKEPLALTADAMRLEQAIVNLLHNAAKYTERGGRISLRVESKGGFAVVTVADNGIGVPSDAFSKIFEPFFQVTRPEEKRSGTGLGIGLMLVKTIAEAHGGTIKVKSEGEGKGSEFILRIPIASSDAEA